MATPSELIFDDAVTHQINLQRFNAGTVRKMQRVLRDADESLAAQIAKMGDSDTAKQRRRILANIQESEKRAEALLAKRMAKEASDLAVHEVGFQAKTIGDGAMAGAAFDTVSLNTVRAAALEKPFKSIHLEWAGLQAHVKELSKRRRALINGTIRRGIVEGAGAREIQRQLIGTRRLNYADGLLQRPRREVEALVRTSMNHAATVSRETFYEQNADLIAGVRWLAVLDSRTSPICQSLDGQIFEPGQGPRPPAHSNCRSTTAAILKGDPVPPHKSYGEWLEGQPQNIQEQALGVEKRRLWKEGKLDLPRFTDQRGRGYSLADLAKVESGAFERLRLNVSQGVVEGAAADVASADAAASFVAAAGPKMRVAGAKNGKNFVSPLVPGAREYNVLTSAAEQEAILKQAALAVHDVRAKAPFFDKLNVTFVPSAQRKMAKGVGFEGLAVKKGRRNYIKAPGASPEAAARAAKTTEQTGIRWGVGDSVQDVFRHEAGHIVHFSQNVKSARRAARAAVQETIKSKNPDFVNNWIRQNVSYYAMKNSDELIAELFALWTDSAYKAGDLPKPVEKFLAKFGKGEF